MKGACPPQHSLFTRHVHSDNRINHQQQSVFHRESHVTSLFVTNRRMVDISVEGLSFARRGSDKPHKLRVRVNLGQVVGFPPASNSGFASTWFVNEHKQHHEGRMACGAHQIQKSGTG